MIRSFSHKGLRLLFEEDDWSKVGSENAPKLRLILSVLNAAATVEDLNQPAFRLHPLKGNLRGFWSVTVRANWRVIFSFADGEVNDVDLVDYH